ncbi:Fic family protein [Candidatus Pacearchaeota archaeon]|nr:Fic family protein [Candidatus Pacearchaeota archaeon]
MHWKIKIIHGKSYKYAAESFRFPDGKIKKIEVLFNNQNKKELENIFNKKKKKAFFEYAIKKYKTDSVFSKEEFLKIESIRVDYSDIIKKISNKDKKDLFDRFTANFTYESNALEGNSLTLKDVAIVMFENSTIKGKDLREIYETRNSRKVVERILDKKFDISEKDIIKIHKILVQDLDIETSYKKFPNILVGKKIRLTPPEKVKEEMANLVEWYHKNKTKIHPLKLISLFHGKFEQIHPFQDGNGRVGRFLINVMLINNNYPPLIIRKSQRISYLTALEKFDNNYSKTLERFFLEKFKETHKKFFEIYMKYL